MRRIVIAALAALVLGILPSTTAAAPGSEGCAAASDAFTSPGRITDPNAAAAGIRGVGAWRVVRIRPMADGTFEQVAFFGDPNGARVLSDVLRAGDTVHCRSFGGAVVAGRMA